MKKAFIYITIILFPITLFGQVNQFEKDGISITQEDSLQVIFDDFTGEATITIQDTLQGLYHINDKNIIIAPAFSGSIEEMDSFDELFSENAPKWGLTFLYKGNNEFFSIDSGLVSISVPFLVDDDRMTIDVLSISEMSQNSVGQFLIFKLTETTWNHIASAQDVRFRIAGKVTQIPESTLVQMTRISEKVDELRRDTGVEEQEIEEPEPIEKDEVRGAPYQLHWEGDLDRTPMVQPLPSNSTNTEATVTIRFEVNPDGSLGRVYPLKEMNPELEREVMSTLRSWRFSRLPQGVPQEPQLGTITFRFVID